MANIPKVQLNNGVEMPIIGLGAYAPPESEPQRVAKDWILTAINNGFRHIDTAFSYLTEKAVGQAIKESGVPREEFFVTTKLPWVHHGRVHESFEESLANLDTGYIDLYLIHWPQALVYEGDELFPKNPDGTFKTTDEFNFNQSWAEMEKLLDTGKVRAIGVSNFSIKTFEQLFKTAKVVPVINQVELHPFLAQNELREYCRRKGIVLTAYAPTGYSTIRDHPLVMGLSDKYKISPAQVIFAWHVSRGTVIVPKSTNSERQKENLTLATLSEEDLGKIWTLDKGERLCALPDEATGQLLGWTAEQLGWESYPATL